jgi:hypothetical protein
MEIIAATLLSVGCNAFCKHSRLKERVIKKSKTGDLNARLSYEPRDVKQARPCIEAPLLYTRFLLFANNSCLFFFYCNIQVVISRPPGNINKEI